VPERAARKENFSKKRACLLQKREIRLYYLDFYFLQDKTELFRKAEK